MLETGIKDEKQPRKRHKWRENPPFQLKGNEEKEDRAFTQADTGSTFSNPQHVIHDFICLPLVSPGSSGRYVLQVTLFISLA